MHDLYICNCAFANNNCQDIDLEIFVFLQLSRRHEHWI